MRKEVTETPESIRSRAAHIGEYFLIPAELDKGEWDVEEGTGFYFSGEVALTDKDREKLAFVIMLPDGFGAECLDSVEAIDFDLDVDPDPYADLDEELDQSAGSLWTEEGKGG